MQSFDISWAAIIKVMLAGAFSYVVLPALLVLRDLILHIFIGKIILTDNLNRLIIMCEDDRWLLDPLCQFNTPLMAAEPAEESILV